MKIGLKPGGGTSFFVFGRGGFGFFIGGFLMPDGTEGISVTTSTIYDSAGVGYYFCGAIGVSTTVGEVAGSGTLGDDY